MVQRYIRGNLPTGDPFPVAAGSCRAKMDQNETPDDLPAPIKRTIANQLLNAPWTRYPQPDDYLRIKTQFAGSLGVPPECLAITNGCDGAIQGIHFLAGGQARRALTFTPTYPMLHHAAWLAGTDVSMINIGPEYQLTSQQIESADLILLANPNNPTGHLTDDDVIEYALNTDAMVFVDEAYFDFSTKTWAGELIDRPNLAIGRSCSKAMLAGVRLGALLAHPDVILTYESLVTAPYHLSVLQLICAENYDIIKPEITRIVDSITDERDRLAQAMSALGIRTYPSHTNFLLFKVTASDQVYELLTANGIRIRNMNKIKGLNSHLRVTVSRPDENDLFLKVLADALNA